MNESPPPVPHKKSRLVPVLVVLVTLLVVTIGVVWWTTRPIKPVELNAEEKAAVQQKVEAIQQAEAPAKPAYEKGKKEIVLTERELNGLLHEHTSLGEKLKLELASEAVHARYEADLDSDFPIVGGKKLKARARFIVKTNAGVPSLVLDDFTLWGVSLPNEWLGQLKGGDLLGEILGGGSSGRIAGIEEMTVSSGELKIRLKD